MTIIQLLLISNNHSSFPKKATRDKSPLTMINNDVHWNPERGLRRDSFTPCPWLRKGVASGWWRRVRWWVDDDQGNVAWLDDDRWGKRFRPKLIAYPAHLRRNYVNGISNKFYSPSQVILSQLHYQFGYQFGCFTSIRSCLLVIVIASFWDELSTFVFATE